MATAKQIAELKEMLEQRKDLILNNIKESKDNIDSLKEQECKDDYDYAEVSSDSFTEGLIANQQSAELTEIEDAIKRIKEGTYGTCQMCDVTIPIGRMKAKPFAKFCTECREIYESEQS